MTIGRNDACPCGSGRKYKKCCLIKESLELKTKQFFQLKYELTTKMLDFLRERLPRQEIKEATQLFQQIQKQETSAIAADSKNKFWLCYFYGFSNGFRGVEWFMEKGKRLTTSEQALLSRWVQMRPRLLQVTGEEPSGVTVADLITKETFFLPYCESLQKGVPGGVAIAMLEPLGDAHCIHGITSFKDTKLADDLVSIVQGKMQETGKSYPDAMLDYYLELMEFTFSHAVQPEQGNSQAPADIDHPKTQLISEEDMAFYEQVGLTQETAFTFYAEDLVQFFKEKSLGKSASTVKKYQWGVQKVVNYFHSLDGQPLSWKDCLRAYWEDLISRFYLLDSPDSSLSQAHSFLSVMKNLTQWLDKKHQTDHSPLVKDILNEIEEDLLNSVRFKTKELITT